MRNYFLFLIIFVFSFQACKDDCNDISNPDCSNYDPCFGVEAANADFHIFEPVGSNLSETDTILWPAHVIFRAKQEADSFKWLLGSEVLDTKEVYRNGFPSYEWIDVTLITFKNEHPCLEKHQLSDTMLKRFIVVNDLYRNRDTNFYRALPWWGTWRGYNTDAPDEEFEISLGYIDKYNRPSFDLAFLPQHLPLQKPFYGDAVMNTGVGGGYKLMTIEESNQIGPQGGFSLSGIIYREGKTITIEYKYNNRPYQQWLNGVGVFELENEPIEWVSKTFKGRKISNKIKTQ